MNKKGFTLIELLAVIVILAIIMIIAIPKILNVIDNSKRMSFENSANLMAKDASLLFTSNQFDGTSAVGTYQFENGEYKGENKLNFKGELPYSGVISINENGKVAMAIVSSKTYGEGKWCAIKHYDNKNVVVFAYKGNEEKCSLPTSIVKGDPTDPTNPDDPTKKYKVYNLGDSINYDVTTGKGCTKPDRTTEVKEGCMRFYVIDDDDNDTQDKINVILDHNTTDVNYWSEIENDLSNDTRGWKVYSGTSPKILSMEDLTKITGDYDRLCSYGKCQSGSGTTTFSYKYQFLYVSTSGCTSKGCSYDNSGYLNGGYWTTTLDSDSSAWGLYGNSYNATSINYNRQFGVRPSVTLSKDAIANIQTTETPTTTVQTLKTYNIGEAIYFNVQTGTGCTENDYNNEMSSIGNNIMNTFGREDFYSRTFVKSSSPLTCLKFYNITTNDSGNNRVLEAILEHGIMEGVVYSKALNAIEQETSYWKVSGTYSGNNSRLLRIQDLTNIKNSGVDTGFLFENVNYGPYSSGYFLESNGDKAYKTTSGNENLYEEVDKYVNTTSSINLGQSRPVIKIDKATLN